MRMWSDIIVQHARSQQMYSLILHDLHQSNVCNNQKIKRRLSLDALREILDWMQKQGFADYTSDSKDKVFVYWRPI